MHFADVILHNYVVSLCIYKKKVKKGLDGVSSRIGKGGVFSGSFYFQTGFKAAVVINKVQKVLSSEKRIYMYLNPIHATNPDRTTSKIRAIAERRHQKDRLHNDYIPNKDGQL